MLDEYNINYKYLVLLYSCYNLFILTWLDYRQFQCLKSKEVPSQLRSRMSEKAFIEIQSNNQYEFSLSVLRRLVNEMIHFIMIVFDLLPYCWELSEYFLISIGYSKHYGIVHSFVFLSMYVIVAYLKVIPFEFYLRFANPQQKEIPGEDLTKAAYLIYAFKQVIVSMLGMGFGLSAFLWVADKVGENFYWYLGIIGFFVYFLNSTVWKYLFGPFYGSIRELPKGELRLSIERYCKTRKINFPVTNIYIVDPDQEKHHSSLYFFGFLHNKQLCLYNRLVKKCDHEEIKALITHEIAHWKFWHEGFFIIFRHIHLFILYYLFGQMYNNPKFYANFGFPLGEMPHFVGLMLIKFTYDPFETLIGFIARAIIRQQEYKADKYTVEMGQGRQFYKALLSIDFNKNVLMVPDYLRSIAYDERPNLVYRLQYLEMLLGNNK